MRAAGHSSHVSPQQPGASILRAPGHSFEPDPWHINKFDNSTNKKTRKEEYAQEQIRKRGLSYEDLPGKPKKFSMLLKMRDVARHRNIDCEHYNDCLGYAAFHNWPSFICTGCEYAEDL